MTNNENNKLDEGELDQVAGGAVISAPIGGTVYSGFGPYGGAVVWPPVDPNTASGLPPLIAPGGNPPGY